jgi:23S rRNA pseudouridine955/2504/2580 synthase/23S rRNA pseudouridine1911/1915/1917 synthase
MKQNLHILFENDRMIAVDKPAGIIVIPDQYTDRAHTLQGAAEEYAKTKIWVVHRIDRDTTGVVLFAKDAEAHALLCRQFESGTVSKKYLALVNGSLEDEAGTIDRPLRIEGRKVEVADDGKESVTLYNVLERFKDFTLVEASPRTGRRHQIRIHFWSLGHPLAVDPEYASRTALYLSEFKRNYKSSGREEKPLLGRLSLHAASVRFTEPASNAEKTVESPLPHDLEVTLKQLRKYNHR